MNKNLKHHTHFIVAGLATHYSSYVQLYLMYLSLLCNLVGLSLKSQIKASIENILRFDLKGLME